jgi:hypothetical protein
LRVLKFRNLILKLLVWVAWETAMNIWIERGQWDFSSSIQKYKIQYSKYKIYKCSTSRKMYWKDYGCNAFLYIHWNNSVYLMWIRYSLVLYFRHSCSFGDKILSEIHCTSFLNQLHKDVLQIIHTPKTSYKLRRQFLFSSLTPK